MTPVDDLLVKLLRCGTSTTVQHLAWEASLSAEKNTAVTLLRALARTKDLDEDLRHHIAVSLFSEARCEMWAREDISVDMMLQYLPTERSVKAIGAMLGAIEDTSGPVADILRAEMRAPHAKALLEHTTPWAWPSDIVAAALGLAGRNSHAKSLALSGLDLTYLARDDSLKAILRLGACASHGTPGSAVRELLPTLLDELAQCQSNEEQRILRDVLKAMLSRPADADVGHAILAAAKAHPWVPDDIVARVDGWTLDMGQVSNPSNALELVTTPAELKTLWEAMTLAQRGQHRVQVIGHLMCDLELKTAVLDQFPGTQVDYPWNPAVWMLQDPQAFLAEMGAGPVRDYSMLTAAAESPYAAPFADLVEPYFTALLARDPKSKYSHDKALATMMRVDAFPKPWLRHIPAGVVLTILKDYQWPELGWVAAELSDLLDGLYDGREHLMPLLASVLTTDRPIHDAVKAATIALRTT